ncbi:MAG TPA: hypothetical protein VJS17_12050 [Pyrinomonadaceae bacterium]|nr:hypothetical protein [Pyrinomonadaceae bacterium]
MKRCPQCEFIYEDDQSLCDMDGVLLVFDARTLPNIHALATVEGPMPSKVQRRYRMAPAFATILLTLGLGSAYFVSTRGPAPAPVLEIPASVTTTTTAEAPAPVPSPSVEEAVVAPTPESQPPTAEPAAAAKPERKPTTPAKKAAPQPAPVKPGVKPAETKKDDSKVGSILKKTGKILKKPFKF